MDQATFKVTTSHPDDVSMFKELNARKTSSMQIWVAVGGYDFSVANSPTHQTSSRMTSTGMIRATFIRSLRECMDTHGFQVVDLDWNYSSAKNLRSLLEMRQAFLYLSENRGRLHGVGFDDSETLAEKTSWAVEKCFGGTMIWSLDMDSSHGRQGDETPSTDRFAADSFTVAMYQIHGNLAVARFLISRIPIQFYPFLWLQLQASKSTDPASIASVDKSVARKSTSASKSVQAGNNIVPVVPPPIAPGKSSLGKSTTARSNAVTATTSGLKSTTSSQAGPSKKSSSTRVSSSATGSRSSSQSTGATSQGQALAAALMIPGITTIPSPTLAPEFMDFTKFSGSGTGKRDGLLRRQATSAKPDDLGLLEKEVGLMDIKSLLANDQEMFDGMRKALPDIDSGLKTGISSLSKSMKNPGQVNAQDIARANSLLGKQGPETQQVASTFKQLTGWKAPGGSNDFILPARRLVTGTVIPGILTIPSPTLLWSKALMSGSKPGGSSGRASGGASGGAGGGLLGTLTLRNGGVGPQRHYDRPRKYQTYLGHVTLEEAFAVNENTILDGKRITDMIGPNKIKTHWSGNSISPGREQKAFFDSDKGSNATMLLPRVNPTWDEFSREPDLRPES
ncbi:MAG: hypothetical protein Q9173_000435 [Seirophora scorigena]